MALDDNLKLLATDIGAKLKSVRDSLNVSIDTLSTQLISVLSIADLAVKPDNPRVPIVLLESEYQAITPVPGQVYIVTYDPA